MHIVAVLTALSLALLFFPQATFSQSGRLDLIFPDLLGEDANVTALAVQDDGKIVAAGYFRLNGSTAPRNVIRFSPDGTVDPTFNQDFADVNIIERIRILPNGKILITGTLHSVNGVERHGMVRLNPDGSLDESFRVSGIDVFYVYNLDVQPDGRILISASGGATGTAFVARLLPDGANELSSGAVLFSRPGGGDYRVSFVAADNKILVGGDFTYTVGGNEYRNLARLNLDGSIDSTFRASLQLLPWAQVPGVQARSHGNKILVWGRFSAINQLPRASVALLNADGSVDTSFVPATGGSASVKEVFVQQDGRIIIGGNDFPPGIPVRGNMTRLNQDGTIDYSFNVGRGARGEVHAFLPLNGGTKLLVGGHFFKYGLIPRSSLIRIFL